jgi:copper ion binding protein
MSAERSYTVPGMSCAHCEAAIANEVGKVAGVTAVEVDRDAKTVLVRGDGVSHADVRAAIDDAGYDVA